MSFIRLVGMLVILLVTTQAFALSDADYKNMTSSSPEFKAAEDQLNQTWKILKGKITVDAFSRLKIEQNEWIKARDSNVEKSLASGSKTDKAALYAQENLKRIDYLKNTYLTQSGSPSTPVNSNPDDKTATNATGDGKADSTGNDKVDASANVKADDFEEAQAAADRDNAGDGSTGNSPSPQSGQNKPQVPSESTNSPDTSTDITTGKIKGFYPGMTIQQHDILARHYKFPPVVIGEFAGFPIPDNYECASMKIYIDNKKGNKSSPSDNEVKYLAGRWNDDCVNKIYTRITLEPEQVKVLFNAQGYTAEEFVKELGKAYKISLEPQIVTDDKGKPLTDANGKPLTNFVYENRDDGVLIGVTSPRMQLLIKHVEVKKKASF